MRERTSATVRVYIGLGSNLEEPRRQVESGFDELAGLDGSELTARSPLYRSAPMGPRDQPDYVNAVAALETTLHPLDLLHALQSVENLHGRERGVRWGPRTLDLDILLYGTAVIHTAVLTVPHPGLRDRAFVLRPLTDLNPDLALPGGGTPASLLAARDRDDLEPIAQ